MPNSIESRRQREGAETPTSGVDLTKLSMPRLLELKGRLHDAIAAAQSSDEPAATPLLEISERVNQRSYREVVAEIERRAERR